MFCSSAPLRSPSLGGRGTTALHPFRTAALGVVLLCLLHDLASVEKFLRNGFHYLTRPYGGVEEESSSALLLEFPAEFGNHPPLGGIGGPLFRANHTITVPSPFFAPPPLFADAQKYLIGDAWQSGAFNISKVDCSTSPCRFNLGNGCFEGKQCPPVVIFEGTLSGRSSVRYVRGDAMSGRVLLDSGVVCSGYNRGPL